MGIFANLLYRCDLGAKIKPGLHIHVPYFPASQDLANYNSFLNTVFMQHKKVAEEERG